MANENQVAFFLMFLYFTMFVDLAQRWKKGRDISLVFLAGLELDNFPLENYLSMFLFTVLQLPSLSQAAMNLCKHISILLMYLEIK